MLQLVRDIKLDILSGKYKCISSYKIPEDVENWLPCPNCNLIPLINVYDNHRGTGCGCGKNIYDHFSIRSESIMSVISRNNGSTMEYDIDGLKNNWNIWVKTGEVLESQEYLTSLGRW